MKVFIVDPDKPSYLCWIGIRRVPSSAGGSPTSGSDVLAAKTSDTSSLHATTMDWKVPTSSVVLLPISTTAPTESPGVPTEMTAVHGAFFGDRSHMGLLHRDFVFGYSPRSFANRSDALAWLTGEGTAWAAAAENYFLFGYATSVKAIEAPLFTSPLPGAGGSIDR